MLVRGSDITVRRARSCTDWFRKPSGIENLTVLEVPHKFAVTPKLQLKKATYKSSQDLMAEETLLLSVLSYRP